MAHMGREGAFTGLTQRLDSEQELVTCDMNGRLLFWDCDVPDPVQVLQSPQRMTMRCVSVSPTGRYLAICGDFLVNVFDLRGGVLRRGLRGGGLLPADRQRDLRGGLLRPGAVRPPGGAGLHHCEHWF